MGAGKSIPVQMPSKDSYRQKTVPSQNLVNNIFLWMLSETNIQDLLKLANPKYCKDYVFFTKEALDTFFDQIKLDPKVDKRQTLYFESVRQLTFADEKAEKAMPQQKTYRDELCGKLAFFYIRIFQIFGALALTVIDTFPETKPTELNIRAAALLPKVRAPPLFGERTVYTGGAKVDGKDKENVSALGVFLNVAQQYLHKFGRPGIYIISQTSIGTRQFNPQNDTNTIFFFSRENGLVVLRTSSSNNIEANISIQNYIEATSYILVIENIELNSQRIPNSFTIPMTYRRGDYFYLDYNFYSVIYNILMTILKEGDTGKSLEEILKEKVVIQGPRKNIDERAITGIEEPYTYIPILKYLKEKPKAYCVARAIQLLSPTLLESVQKGTPYISHICFSTNPEFKDSVPNYGQPITPASGGIRALNQLFYDFLQGNVPKISEETRPKYQQFVREMQSVFSPDFPSKDLVGSLDKVKSGSFRACDEPSLKDKEILLTNENAVREIRKSVAALLNEQITHTANVMNLLKQIFVISKEGRILGLEPGLLKGGIPAVNAMAENARTLLTDYYKKCEGTFRLGALAVLAAPNKVVRERAK
jgi:hypothetical protein